MPFQEAPFKPGDCLTFASVELEIEDRTSAHVDCFESDAPTAEVVESKVEIVERATVSPPAFEITPTVEPDFEGDRALLSPVTMDERENDLGTADEKAARGARRTRDRVRQTQDEYRQLADRVEGLECLMEAALFALENLPEKIAENEQRSPAPAVVSGAVPSTEANDQLVCKTAALESEIGDLKSRLAAAERAIAEWELRREALDQERARWEADRTEWETNRSDVPARLAESEIRLAEYFSRIEKLEQELAAVGKKSADTDGSWTESKVRDGQSGTENVRESADKAWPVTEHRGFGHPRGDTWSNAVPQSSLSDPPSSDNQPPSFSSFQPPITPEAPVAQFDWSGTRNSRTSEWQAGSQGDEPSVVAPQVSESATSTGSHWSGWQTEASQSRNSAVIPADIPAIAVNVWQSHAASDTASASAQPLDAARSELIPIGSGSVPAGELSWPASASAVPSESEDDYAPFAEFSIWNQGADSKDPTQRQEDSNASWGSETAAGAVGTPADEQSAVASEPDQPNDVGPRKESPTSSFIERYAHMFTDDDSVDEASQPAAPPRQAEDDNLVRKPRAFAGTLPSDQEPSEDEESIEQYMAKLMQRVRGERPRVAASQAPIAAAHEVADVPGLAGQASSPAAIHEMPLPTDASTPSISEVNKEEFLTTSLGTVRRRSVTVERPANLEAFRALANESARRAISTHALQKHRRNAVTKAIVATLAGMTSVFVMLEAPDWLDFQFITACVSLLVAAYWAGQTYGDLG